MRCTAVLVTTLAVASAVSAAAAERVDVSKIISKTDAANILGQPVKTPTPLNVDSKDGYYSKCNYYSTKSVRSLLVRVREAAENTLDPEKEFEQVAVSGGAMKPVDSLGDRAGMFNGAPENGLPPNVVILYAVKGKFFVTVGIGGLKDEAAAVEKAKEVTRKILAQL